VIVLVCTPSETPIETDEPVIEIGSPRELNVSVKAVVLTPYGSRPEGSRLFVGENEYEFPPENVMVFEVRVAIAHSWAYRISEATIFAAPSTEVLEVAMPMFNLGIATAARIAIIIMMRITSMMVKPFKFGVRSKASGPEGPLARRELGVFIPHSAIHDPHFKCSLFIVYRPSYII
jgi:hypothetical protein